MGNSKGMNHKIRLVEETIHYIALDSEAQLDVRSGTRLIVSSSALRIDEEVIP